MDLAEIYNNMQASAKVESRSQKLVRIQKELEELDRLAQVGFTADYDSEDAWRLGQIRLAAGRIERTIKRA